MPTTTTTPLLPHCELLQLKRWNTPTIYNGWEQITSRDFCADAFNIEETRDFMPQMGPMVGYAVTVVIEPSNASHRKTLQDLDKPRVIGSFWGEVNANIHRALGCVGTITDGAIRDVDEMTNAGFKSIARRLCVGHAAVQPVRFNCDVEVFGRKVSPGDLIHADKHGFMVITPEEQPQLLEAAKFMDTNECETVIAAARNSSGLTTEEILDNLSTASRQFRDNAKQKFARGGEW
jgi:regulator of RNase E activity RraA